jgi:hypothetical protein
MLAKSFSMSASVESIAQQVQPAQTVLPPPRSFPQCKAKVNDTLFSVNTDQTRRLADALCDPELIAVLVKGAEELPTEEQKANTLHADTKQFFELFDAYITQYDALLAEKQNLLTTLSEMTADSQVL